MELRVPSEIEDRYEMKNGGRETSGGNFAVLNAIRRFNDVIRQGSLAIYL